MNYDLEDSSFGKIISLIYNMEDNHFICDNSDCVNVITIIWALFFNLHELCF